MGNLGHMPAAEQVELAAGECRVFVCPGTGGAIARFAWRDADILRRAPDEAIAGGTVRQMGCYPLVPYSNRIGQARLRFGTEEYALQPNLPPEPHALHGVGWSRSWKVARRSASTARLELAHEPDADWPFAFEASQSISLDREGLSLALEPVSHVIDAYALAASGHAGTGMRVLAPGEALRASMRIGVGSECSP